MELYIILSFIAIIFVIIVKDNRRENILFSSLLLLFLCFLCTFRDLECGRDTLNYYYIYETDPNNLFREPLYVLSMIASGDFRLFIALFSVSTYFILIYVICKYLKLSCLGVLIFMISANKFFPESFNIIRQTLAGCLIMYSFIVENNRNRNKAILIIAVAFCIHFSSLIAFPFLFLKKNILLKPYTVITILLISMLIGLSGIFNMLFITSLKALSFISGDLYNLIILKALSYGEQVNKTNITYNLSFIVPAILTCILSYPYSHKAKKQNRYFYNVFLLSTLIGNLLIPSFPYGFRFIFSLSFIQIILIPNAYNLCSKQYKKYFWGLFVLLLIIHLHYLYNMPLNTQRGIVPYKSIFF